MYGTNPEDAGTVTILACLLGRIFSSVPLCRQKNLLGVQSCKFVCKGNLTRGITWARSD